MASRPVRVVGLLALGLVTAASPAEGAVPRLVTDGRQALGGGYERVHGRALGRVPAGEPVRGLARGGLPYAVEWEVVRPVAERGRRARLLLVEAENRGSPVFADRLLGLDRGRSGPPSAAPWPRGADVGFLRRHRLAYARVQWQTGAARDVPATAQGAGEVVVRDFARALAPRFPRRALVGVSQGAFFVNTFVAEGFNAVPGGGRAYGQALTVDGNGNWLAINRLAGRGRQDPYLRPDGRPLAWRRLLRRPRTDPELIDVAAYTDFYRLRAGVTGALPLPRGVRRYDWPAPHQSFGPDAVFDGFGCNGGRPIPLNPLDSGPYLRALVAGLARGRLPASRRFRLGRAPRTSPSFNGLPGVAVRVPRVDSRGQPVGGVRFPEVLVPLGRLSPPSLSPSVTTSSGAVCGNSGGFAPFAPAVIARRRSEASHVRAYRGALDRLVAGGYVLADERGALLRGARAAYRRARRP